MIEGAIQVWYTSVVGPLRRAECQSCGASFRGIERVSPNDFKAPDFGCVQARPTTPARLLTCEMLLRFGAFRRVTTDTRSVFFFPHFVF